MDPADVLTRPSDLPDVVVRYGDHADAVLDLHLPPRRVGAPAPTSPLLVFVHGGFWRAAYDRTHTRPLAQAFAAQGFVVATPEYRRVGGPGDLAGGWPATADDVRAAVAALPGLLDGLGVPVTTTTVAGHSAGGHLALWLANEPLPLHRVVALAPVGDLRAAAAAGLGDGAVEAFLGGTPDEVPGRYDAADPATRLADRPACPVTVVHGADDVQVPVGNSRGLARQHPFVDLRVLDGTDHFAVIDPLSQARPVVLSAVRGE